MERTGEALIGREKAKRWDNVTRILKKAEPLWRRLADRTEMQEMVTSTLIKNGEICGTSILAENLLKMQLGQSKKRQSNDEEHVVTVVNNSLKKARELARSKGPLIFVKVDKGYYQYSQ